LGWFLLPSCTQALLEISKVDLGVKNGHQ
jgi:hypothetical protein